MVFKVRIPLSEEIKRKELESHCSYNHLVAGSLTEVVFEDKVPSELLVAAVWLCPPPQPSRLHHSGHSTRRFPIFPGTSWQLVGKDGPKTPNSP